MRKEGIDPNKREQVSIRIPNSKQYWINKGKCGKKVAIYTHDDLDGVFSAIAMKGYLEKRGFEIVSYAIINYQEGWNTTELNKTHINVALDFGYNTEGIDIYIDHHGDFNEGERIKNSIKTKTGSAYEGIMEKLGLPVDELVLSVIDMIDSAKYAEYNIDIKNILDFDNKIFRSRLEFAAKFNQLLKRSDYKTFIEVIANTKEISPSVYNVYRLFKIFYPGNNYNTYLLKSEAKKMNYFDLDGKPDVQRLIKYIKENNPYHIKKYEKDFMDDAYYRIDQKKKKIRGYGGMKPYIDSQETFKKLLKPLRKVEMDGYQIIGNLCYFPSGTWANALSARSILEQDLENDEIIPFVNFKVAKISPLYDELKNKNGQKLELLGDIKDDIILIKHDVTNNQDFEGITGTIYVDGDNIIFKAKRPIMWIMLQYGNTLQIVSFHDFDKYVEEYLPVLTDGCVVDNLAEYCNKLLYNMAIYLGYNVNTIPSALTTAGGHKNIGSISNIWSYVHPGVVKTPNPYNPTESMLLHSSAMDVMSKVSGTRFLDIFRNKMIGDLSGISFKDITMMWGDPDEPKKETNRNEDINLRLLYTKDIRTIDDINKYEKQLEYLEQHNIV